MRVPLLVLPLLALTIVGCAREPMRVPAAQLMPRAVPVPATPALAFTPPAARDIADELDLDRDGRGPYASAGYESQVVSETYVRTDDRQRFDRFGDDGSFQRRAISTTITVRQR
jgi:hypothetical protein